MPAYSDRLVFDLETSAIAGAAGFMEPPTAPASYKDPEAIARYVEKATRDQLEKTALDIDLCRIVAIGTYTAADGHRQVIVPNEEIERKALAWFWTQTRTSNGPQMVLGFNILDFDLPVLIRRSQYLSVPYPSIGIDRFRHPNVIDLMQELSFSGKTKFRSIGFYCKRFGIDVPDDVRGQDIPILVATKDYAKVKSHVRADVEKTRLLAIRLGHMDETVHEIDSAEAVTADSVF